MILALCVALWFMVALVLAALLGPYLARRGERYPWPVDKEPVEAPEREETPS